MNRPSPICWPTHRAAALWLAAATAGLLALTFWLYRSQLALVGRLLGIAGAALWENGLALVGGSLLLQVGGAVSRGPPIRGGEGRAGRQAGRQARVARR